MYTLARQTVKIVMENEFINLLIVTNSKYNRQEEKYINASKIHWGYFRVYLHYHDYILDGRWVLTQNIDSDDKTAVVRIMDVNVSQSMIFAHHSIYLVQMIINRSLRLAFCWHNWLLGILVMVGMMRSVLKRKPMFGSSDRKRIQVNIQHSFYFKTFIAADEPF